MSILDKYRMKREGRMHGTDPHTGRRLWGCDNRQKLSSKPTNQSRSSLRHSLSSEVSRNVIVAEHECPSHKSLGKTKSAFKAKDLDITRNHLMQDWRIYERRYQQFEDSDEEFGESDLSVAAPAGVDDEEMEEYLDAKSGRRSSSEIVLPIESLLRKRKGASKAVPVIPPSVSVSLDERNIDSDESWCGLDFFYDKDLSVDWFLVAEAG